MKYLRDDFCLHVGCWLCRWLRNQSWKPRVPEHSRASGRLHRWDQGRQRQREKKKRPNNLPRPFCTFLWLVFHLWLKRSHRLSLTDCRRGPAANPPPPPPPKKTHCFFRAYKWLWEAVQVLSDGFQIFSVTSVISAPHWVEVFALAQLVKPGVGL